MMKAKKKNPWNLGHSNSLISLMATQRQSSLARGKIIYMKVTAQSEPKPGPVNLCLHPKRSSLGNRDLLVIWHPISTLIELYSYRVTLVSNRIGQDCGPVVHTDGCECRSREALPPILSNKR